MIAAASSTAATTSCPSAIENTCVANPTAASYSNSNGLLTASQCCNQCVLDGSLCYGYIFRPSKGNLGSCSQFDAPISLVHKVPGNCTVGIFAHPQKAAPKKPKTAPKGARNVLFIVADGALMGDL